MIPLMNTDEFWAWLAEQGDRLGCSPEPSLVDEIGDRLQTLRPGLSFELAMADPPLLSISAAGDASLFDLVREIVGHAPPSLPVRVVAFRQRGRVAGAALKLSNDRTLSSEDIWFRIDASGDDDAQLGLHVFVRDYPAEKQGSWQEAVYLLLDNALGEEDVVTKIAWIEWSPLPSNPERSRLRPLLDLPGAFDEALGRPPAS
jgi:hypothetical protein